MSDERQTGGKNTASAILRDLRARMGILGELFRFLWARKNWWLIPMIILLIIFGVLIAFASASGAAPFIYTLF